LIIKELFMEGFGIFHRCSFLDLGDHFNFVYGENEAGKTTFKRFIQFTLFGYPRKKENRCSPLSGGRHGGYLKGFFSTGEDFFLERYGISLNGQTRFFTGSREENEEEWKTRTGYVDIDLYNNLYCLSLDTLSGMEQLRDSGIESRLFSMELGISDTALERMENEYRQKLDSLYKKRGKTPVLNRLLSKRREWKRKLKGLEESLGKYNQLKISCQEEERKKREIELLMEETETNLLKKKNALQYTPLYKDWKRLEGLIIPNSVLIDVQLLEEQYIQLKEQIQSLQENMNKLIHGEQGIGSLEFRLSRLDIKEELLEKSIEIENLREAALKIPYLQERLEEKSEEIEDKEKELERDILSLGKQWTKEKIERLEGLKGYEIFLKGLIEERNQLLERADTAKHYLNQPVFWFLSAAVLFSIVFLFSFLGLGSRLFNGFGFFIITMSLLFIYYYIKKKTDGFSFWKIQMKEIEDKKKPVFEKIELAEDFSIESSLEMLTRIGIVQEKILNINRLKEKVEKIKTDLENLFREIRNYVRFEPSIAGNEILGWKKLVSRLEEEKRKENKRDMIINEIQAKKEFLRQYEIELKGLQEKISSVLHKAGAEQEEEWRMKIIEIEENNKRILRKNDLEKEFRFVYGEEWEREIEKLQGLEEEKNSEEIDFLMNRKKELKEIFENIQNHLGGLAKEIEILEKDETHEKIQEELEETEFLLRKNMEKWIMAGLSLRIMDKALEKIEKERQPAVARKTSEFFRKMTLDRYQEMRISIKNREVLVFDKNGQNKNLNQLSRGSKEQLLTALRFALIEEYERKRESLPLLIDDSMVNFDEERLRKTISILRQLSKNRQVFFFSCRKEWMEFFSGDNIISLSSSLTK